MNDQDARDLKLGRVVRGLFDALGPKGCRLAHFPFVEVRGDALIHDHVSLALAEADRNSDPEAVVRDKILTSEVSIAERVAERVRQSEAPV